MTDDRSQQKDQGLSNLSVDPDLLARELAAEDDVDPLDAIQLDDAEQDSSLEIARSCDQGLVWLAVMLSTPPESDAVLERFVRTVRPPGPGWSRLRQRFGVTPMESLPAMLRRFVLACGVLFGGLLGTGGFLLHQQWSGWIGLSVLILSIWQLRRRVDAVPS